MFATIDFGEKKTFWRKETVWSENSTENCSGKIAVKKIGTVMKFFSDNGVRNSSGKFWEIYGKSWI